MIATDAFHKMLAEHIGAETDKIIDEEARAAAERVASRVKMTCAVVAVRILEEHSFSRQDDMLTIQVNAKEFTETLRKRL